MDLFDLIKNSGNTGTDAGSDGSGGYGMGSGGDSNFGSGDGSNAPLPRGVNLFALELFNWGTFDKKVWNFTPNGKTSLLTGESGSGKSTVVDALLTLLAAQRKIVYNKAADGDSRERNTLSYVLGYYGRKYAYDGKGKPEALRTENTYSVVLGNFKESDGTVTSLAVFFWFRENEKNPSRFYAVAEKEMHIVENFANFNGEIRALRSRLKSDGVAVFDDFKHYAEHYRKRMGGLTEQSVDLFQQTISMKKVEALNDFVRVNMLEKEDTETQVDELLRHYHNLDRAHEAVLKARKQIEMLTPIHNMGSEYEKKHGDMENYSAAHNAVGFWFAAKKTKLYEEAIKKIREKLDSLNMDKTNEDNKLSDVEKEISTLTVSIAKNGGNDIERIEGEIDKNQTELETRKRALTDYTNIANALNLKPGGKRKVYEENSKALESLISTHTTNKVEALSDLEKAAVQRAKHKEEKEEYDEEIKSLKTRTSNIPAQLVRMRSELCRDLDFEEELLPFAGELLEVKEEEAKWEGAIERLLHGFAISMLVPDSLYGDVAAWVNSRHLGQKLVYFRTTSRQNRAEMIFKIDDGSGVYEKLSVKPESPFAEWLKGEIMERFPHVCCDNIEEFKHQQKAITISGQIKAGMRHEKDDRRKIQDRSTYVLGFSNRKKLEMLIKLSEQCETKIGVCDQRRSELSRKMEAAQKALNLIDKIKVYSDYKMIDVQTPQDKITDLQGKLAELRKGNSILNTLQNQLKAAEEEKEKISAKLSVIDKAIGNQENEFERNKSEAEENAKVKAEETEDSVKMYAFIEEQYAQFADKEILTLKNCRDIEPKYTKLLANKSISLQTETAAISEKIGKRMAQFRMEYPLETQELGEDVTYQKDYNNLLQQLQYHNLPKYQENFKHELQGKIIQHISLFNAMLNKYRNKITGRIADINTSLYGIDYNPDRYIELCCEDTPEGEIRAFRQQLKLCTEGMTSGIANNEMAEVKFAQIKDIIQRFKGRPECAEADKRWTARVTDVRNWFIFSAFERWRDSGEEYEHYADSDGKSGGQKEKLAYTILAASLAYNYKINEEDDYSRERFRLVVIDEAFLKSSDDSAKYGLELFKQMKFQLLVVTPLLKISTIEPYISHVGYVSYSDITHNSELKNIPIDVYRENRKEWEERNNGN